MPTTSHAYFNALFTVPYFFRKIHTRNQISANETICGKSIPRLMAATGAGVSGFGFRVRPGVRRRSGFSRATFPPYKRKTKTSSSRIHTRELPPIANTAGAPAG